MVVAAIAGQVGFIDKVVEMLGVSEVKRADVEPPGGSQGALF
jgi:hypothetical protein